MSWEITSVEIYGQQAEIEEGLREVAEWEEVMAWLEEIAEEERRNR